MDRRSKFIATIVSATLLTLAGCSGLGQRRDLPFDIRHEFFSTAYTTLFGMHLVRFTSFNVVDGCPGQVPVKTTLRSQMAGSTRLTITGETCPNAHSTLHQCSQCLDLLSEEVDKQMEMFTSLLQIPPPAEIHINLTQKPDEWARRFVWKKNSPIKVAMSFATYTGDTTNTTNIKSYLQQNILGPLLHETYHAATIQRKFPDFESESEAYVFSRCADILSDGQRNGWNLLFLDNQEWREKFATGLDHSELVQTAQDHHPSLSAGFLADINMRIIELEAERDGRQAADAIDTFCRQYFDSYPDLREGFISVAAAL